MTMHFDSNIRAAGTRRLLVGLGAVAGLVCGIGAAGAQSRATPPAPPAASSAPLPPAPSPLAQRVFDLNGGSATYTLKSNVDGREIELRLENNTVVTARVNGKDIPGDRIDRDGDTVKFKDEDGKVIFEHTITTAAPAMVTLWSGRGQNGAISIAPGLGGGRNTLRGMIPGPDDHVMIAAEPPNVMLGVMMMEPDPSLRGHFGLEPGASTLVSAVYGGLPADAAGVEPYDIIVALDGKKPASTEAIRAALRDKNAGDEVKFTIIHRGKEREVAVKLEKYDRERFDETKVRAISTVMEKDQADWYMPGMATQGLVGVAPGPNSPTTVFVQPRMALEQAVKDANARMQAELERARAELERTQLRLDSKSSQTRSLEDRMRHMERLLERLLEEQTGEKRRERDGGAGGGGGHEGGGAGTEPIPEELRPAKGIWAHRSPAV